MNLCQSFPFIDCNQPPQIAWAAFEILKSEYQRKEGKNTRICRSMNQSLLFFSLIFIGLNTLHYKIQKWALWFRKTKENLSYSGLLESSKGNSKFRESGRNLLIFLCSFSSLLLHSPPRLCTDRNSSLGGRISKRVMQSCVFLPSPLPSYYVALEGVVQSQATTVSDRRPKSENQWAGSPSDFMKKNILGKQ